MKKDKIFTAANRRLGERGNALVTAMFVAGVITAGTYAIYQRFSDTKESFRPARVKSLMSMVENQLRNRALQPEAYSGCTSSGVSSCAVNPNFFMDLVKQPVSGAECNASLPNCGITVSALSFQPSTKTFQAEIRYEGKEVKMKPSMLSVKIPVEILQAQVFNCGAMDASRPVFAGFDGGGRPICRGFSPSTCKNGEFVKNVDFANKALTCQALPTSASCGAQRMISSVNWNGGSLTSACSDLPDPPYTGKVITSPTPPTGCSAADLVTAQRAMIKRITRTVIQVADNCKDGPNPTRADNMPTSAAKLVRLFVTCAKRWCTDREHFYTGRGFELAGSGDQLEIDCLLASPPPGVNPECKVFLDANPPIKNFTEYSITEIANNCRDPSMPGLPENMPGDAFTTARFQNTCGNRYCSKLGFNSGTVVEYDTATGKATLQCYDSSTAGDGPGGTVHLYPNRSDVARGCQDTAFPLYSENTYEHDAFRFMNTCSNRYCKSQLDSDGVPYPSGRGVEARADGTVDIICNRK